VRDERMMGQRKDFEIRPTEEAVNEERAIERRREKTIGRKRDFEM